MYRVHSAALAWQSAIVHRYLSPASGYNFGRMVCNSSSGRVQLMSRYGEHLVSVGLETQLPQRRLRNTIGSYHGPVPISKSAAAYWNPTIETRRRLLAFPCRKAQYGYLPTHILQFSPVTFHMHQGSWNCHISWEFDLSLHKLTALACSLWKMKLYADPLSLTAVEWCCAIMSSWLCNIWVKVINVQMMPTEWLLVIYTVGWCQLRDTVVYLWEC
jgi:hypothetical protein